jgi:hypothetical protein
VKTGIDNGRRMWINHVEGAKNHSGTVISYCRLREISPAGFYYWKDKLAKESSSAMLPSFIPVEVTRSAQSSGTLLPDPAWLAQLIFHLQAGGGR